MSEQIEFLKKAENDLFNQIQELRNRSNESLESGAQYCFVLCNAKINFINSLLNDVRFAMSGHAPQMVIDSVIEAVTCVEENFKPFLGTPCETSLSTERKNSELPKMTVEESQALSERMFNRTLEDMQKENFDEYE